MRVSTAEFISGFDDLADRAETEPVTITHGGRDRVVPVSAGEHARLIGYDGVVSATGAAPEHRDGRASRRDARASGGGALQHTVV